MGNYKGAIINQLFTAVERNPDMTMGEIFHSFLRKSFLGKATVEATDEEIYTAVEAFSHQSDEDEPYDEVGFDFFVQKLIVKE